MDQARISSDLATHTEQLNQLNEDSFGALTKDIFEHYITCCEDNTITDVRWPKKDNKLGAERTEVEWRAVDSLYRFVAYISRSVMKPKLVHKALTDAGLRAPQSDHFVEQWKNYAPRIVETLKSSSFELSSDQLKDVHWKLHLVTEQSCSSQQKMPLAEIDFDLGSASASTNLSLNFTHDELRQFYEHLEQMQNRFDQLHSQ